MSCQEGKGRESGVVRGVLRRRAVPVHENV